jgi:formylglycine-generating enzyme required for sulfatase activity
MTAIRILTLIAAALSLQTLIAENIPVRSHPVTLDLTFHSQGKEKSTKKRTTGTTTTSYSAPIIQEKFGNTELLNYLTHNKVIDSVNGWSLKAYYDEVTCEPYGDGIYIEKKGKHPIGIMSLYDAELKQVMFADAYKGQATKKSNGVSSDNGTGSTTGQMMFSFGGTPRVHGTLNSIWAYSDYEDANTSTSQTLISRANSTNISGVVPTPSGEKMVTGSVSLGAGTRIWMPKLAPTDEITEIEGLSLIPAGAFTMGNSVAADTDITDARRTRAVTLDAFYMGMYEVTKAEWDEVRTWGLSNGYTDLAAGIGKASNHPVHSIDWYNMVKWCNARSEMEGLTPAYYTNNTQTTIYKTGDVDVTNAQVKWSANGYRLPTEAEWEKAARGGLSGKRFPWGNTISHSRANYYAYSGYSYDSSGSMNNHHPTYATGSTPYTSPVGAFAANGYGLHDMAGNVFEWCWDWHGTYAAGSQTNPRGSTSGTRRVFRGGSWDSGADDGRVALRDHEPPGNTDDEFGFRVVRSSAP